MSDIKIIMGILCRMFSTRRIKALSGIRKRITLTEKDESSNIEDMDEHDISEYESDFFNVDESHKMHEREMQINKERLKQQIVEKKYFKENEPRFLTFAERELIHKLHDSDPEEWTVEQLSKSFPVLPEGIEKILKHKWLPKSVEKVIRYDNVVIENWKKFRAGKLPVSPAYKEHLMKFKDRKIILKDRELLAKQYVAPKPKFNKPNSQIFSNIIQNYLNEEHNSKLLQEGDPNQKSNYSDENNTVLISDDEINNDNNYVNDQNKLVRNNEGQLIPSSSTNSDDYNIIPYDKKKDIEPKLTFNEFIKQKLEDIYKSSPEEGITLLNVYKKQVEVKQQAQTIISDNSISNAKKDTTLQTVQESDQNTSDSSPSFNESIKQKLEAIYESSPEKGITLLNVYKKQIEAEQKVQISDNTISNAKGDTTLQTVQASDQDTSDLLPSKNENSNSHIDTIKDNSTETCIKAWTKKIDTENSYAAPIKIAKSVYKPGMTYRISDCYYDYDGEFLYRVPGVQN